MKKLLFILLVFILLVNCRPVFLSYFDVNKEYIIVNITKLKTAKRNEVLLKDVTGNDYYFYTFEESYKVGDKFKLIKIEENKINDTTK